MIPLTQAILPLAVLSLIVFGSPLAEENKFKGLPTDLPSEGLHFQMTDNNRIYGSQDNSRISRILHEEFLMSDIALIQTVIWF